MLLFTFPPEIPLPNAHPNYNSTLIFPHIHTKHHPHPPCTCRATDSTSAQRPLLLAATASTSLRQVSSTSDDEDSMVSSASAVAAAIRAASTSPVEFVQRIERNGGGGGAAKNKALVLPSQDFQRLCLEQLHLFRRIVDPDALLSVYVRPAGSYVMNRLELRCITSHPGGQAADIVVLIGNFSMPAGLRVAEASISRQQAEFFPELGAVVLPMVTHPFIVGFLVAEFPKAVDRGWHGMKDSSVSGKSLPLPHSMDPQPLDVQSYKDYLVNMPKFSSEQKLNAINITHSLALAYVMDQKTMLLQQSSWQNNVRMSNLVEQLQGSLSNIRTLTKMLSVLLKRSEVSYDIAQDIEVQGEHMRDTLQQLQNAVYLTKANIVRYNNETLRKMQQSYDEQPEVRSPISSNTSMETSISKIQDSGNQFCLSSRSNNDSEFPMPPLTLAPSHQQRIRRPCEVSELLQDLVGAIKPLECKQRRIVELCNLSMSLKVAVEEPALRQALSNLIEGALLRTEVGGRVEIISTRAPAGGALIIIDDDGPDMHYMTQMHSLVPFGADLCAEDRIEDNMAWNFVAGLTVAREILESYGCVVRVISPINTEAVLGVGGTRLEIWLPSMDADDCFVQEA